MCLFFYYNKQKPIELKRTNFFSREIVPNFCGKAKVNNAQANGVMAFHFRTTHVTGIASNIGVTIIKISASAIRTRFKIFTHSITP